MFYPKKVKLPKLTVPLLRQLIFNDCLRWCGSIRTLSLASRAIPDAEVSIDLDEAFVVTVWQGSSDPPSKFLPPLLSYKWGSQKTPQWTSSMPTSPKSVTWETQFKTLSYQVTRDRGRKLTEGQILIWQMGKGFCQPLTHNILREIHRKYLHLFACLFETTAKYCRLTFTCQLPY